MTLCEKCWHEAGVIAHHSGVEKVVAYNRLLAEREDNPCTPEEQCGEAHVVVEWKDGSRRCLCGKQKEPQP